MERSEQDKESLKSKALRLVVWHEHFAFWSVWNVCSRPLWRGHQCRQRQGWWWGEPLQWSKRILLQSWLPTSFWNFIYSLSSKWPMVSGIAHMQTWVELTEGYWVDLTEGHCLELKCKASNCKSSVFFSLWLNEQSQLSRKGKNGWLFFAQHPQDIWNPLCAIVLNISVLKLSRCGTLNWLLFIFGPEPLQHHTLLFFILFYPFYILPLYQASNMFRGNPFKGLTTSVSMNIHDHPSYLQQKVPYCVIWIVCLHKSGFLYCNHRYFRTLVRSHVHFILFPESTKFSSKRKPCRLPMYVTPP